MPDSRDYWTGRMATVLTRISVPANVAGTIVVLLLVLILIIRFPALSTAILN